MTQLVYETTDEDFANRAVAALQEADISSYRVGHGYRNDSAQPCGLPTESQICIYIERDTDHAEANRILISLGAVVENPPPRWLIAGLIMVAAIVAIWVAAAWNT